MEKPFVLIVEDERDIAALFRHVLDLAGYRTEIASHGQTAVERLSTSQPEIVLLDLNLPKISGNDILGMIRNDNRLDHTRVIVVTAHSHIADGLTAKPDLILLKPIELDQLKNLVGRLELSGNSPKPVPILQDPWDKTTHLYNAPFFVNRLAHALNRSREDSSFRFALYLFKLDPSDKRTDPMLAHDWEFILREVAGKLKKILRPTDTIARFDPDTFYMLVENVVSREISIKIADRIQEILYRNIANVEYKIKIPIRVSILHCDDSYHSTDQILGDAVYAQSLASAQGDDYAKYYYQFSMKTHP